MDARNPDSSQRCPVCLGAETGPYSTDRWAIDGKEYRLLRCGACGCVHTFPLPGDSVLERLYRTSFDYRWYQDHYDAKLRDCRIRVREYGPRLGKRVLDFGGGMGYFSKAAAENGLQSVTYDPFVSAQQPAGKDWDCVVALHVLEHSNDLDRTLAQIKDLLAPGGRIILAVPNFESLGYRKLGMRWTWAQPPLVHVFHFTAAGLLALLRRHGFGDLEPSYHERWDANISSDVEQVERFRWLDRHWGIPFLNRSAIYRRWIARRNSRYRFDALAHTLGRSAVDRSDLSELQIVGTLNER